jgi:hypothetical protein
VGGTQHFKNESVTRDSAAKGYFKFGQSYRKNRTERKNAKILNNYNLNVAPVETS